MLFIFSIVAIIFIIIGYLLRANLFNPLSAFAGTWFVIVLLSNIKLSGWQGDISDKTYQILLIMLFLYSLFFFIGNGLRVKPLSLGIRRYTVDATRLKKLFLFWLFVELVEVVYSGGLPIIWYILNNGKTYFDFGIPSVHGLMNSLGLVLVMIATNLALDESNIHIRQKIIGIIIFILLFYFSLVTRQVLISAAIEILIIISFNKPNLIVRRIVPLIFIFIVIFGLIGNFRTGYEPFLYVARINSKIDPIFIGFYWLYMYLTMTITNINNLIIGGFQAIGIDAFSGFIPSFLAPLFHIDSGFYTADYLVTQAFNVSGFFVYFYEGYKEVGVVVISLLYGLISGVVYKNVCSYPCERNYMLFAVLMQIILLSFFDNMLLYLPSSFQFFIIIVLYKRAESLRGVITN